MDNLDQPLWAVCNAQGHFLCHNAPTVRRLVLWATQEAAQAAWPGAVYEERLAWQWAFEALLEGMELEIHEDGS